MKRLVAVILLAYFLAPIYAAPMDAIYTVLQSVPEEERINFVREQLQMGFNALKGKTPTERISATGREHWSDFSANFYNYMVEKYSIKDDETLDLLRKVICFEDGTCIDIGDPGVHPYKK